MSFKPKVALAQDFLLQLARLPVSVHSKVMKWAIQFQADPTSSSDRRSRSPRRHAWSGCRTGIRSRPAWRDRSPPA